MIAIRIDKLLWYLRLTKSRSAAQAIVATGQIRHNGKRVERASHGIAPGDILTLPLADQVKVIRIVTLPQRRGAANEALPHYQLLEERGDHPLDDSKGLPLAADQTKAIKRDLQP